MKFSLADLGWTRVLDKKRSNDAVPIQEIFRRLTAGERYSETSDHLGGEYGAPCIAQEEVTEVHSRQVVGHPGPGREPTVSLENSESLGHQVAGYSAGFSQSWNNSQASWIRAQTFASSSDNAS